jgi:hypothetical protein
MLPLLTHDPRAVRIQTPGRPGDDGALQRLPIRRAWRCHVRHHILTVLPSHMGVQSGPDTKRQ